uniref:Uncharacterized protein n=1 Tax=Manihot esculenta TaxID=3983 RepID=A0A2C9W327_MANES
MICQKHQNWCVNNLVLMIRLKTKPCDPSCASTDLVQTIHWLTLEHFDCTL